MVRRVVEGLIVLGIIAVAGVAAGLSGLGGRDAAAAPSPKLSLGANAVSQVEGSSGTVAVVLTVTLSPAATTTVTVAFTTVDGSAKVGDADYTKTTGTLTFPAGTTQRTISVPVRGDTKLEDLEAFTVKLTSPVNAALGRKAQKVQILNDERPKVTFSNGNATEGVPAVFKPKLAQRYYRQLSLSVRTINRTAKAPEDYTAVSRSISIPANNKKAVTVEVPTVSDGKTEPKEAFDLEVAGAEILAAVVKKGTIVDPFTCPAGSPSPPPPSLPPVPPSPSSPPSSAPPAGVTGGATWEKVFEDDFTSASATAAKWSTGTNSGSMTLEGNGQLQWFTPGSSVVTTDHDGLSTISVLRQRLTESTVADRFYTVRTLSRIYPPTKCPHLYDPKRLAPTDRTLVPYRFTSGMLNSAKSFGFRYGYAEARVKIAKGFALWSAFWMRNWHPWHSEIDIMEAPDRYARLMRSTYWWDGGSHFGTNNNGGDLGLLAAGGTCRAHVPVPATSTNTSQCSLANAIDLSQGYHTIGLNWTPTKYEVYVDGVKRWTSKSGAWIDPDYNHLVIDLAFVNDMYENDWTKEPVKPLDSGLLASGWFPKPTVEWDYVRVWQAPGQRDICTTGSC